ncbi:Zinc finger and BTB domain-containing protein 7B [Portunus trituberculatus]|uniref:Zinc finger and BTB domain-containing protein 7B n=1 Tax=Portunus trituberculatus TaxID=210409 RepID=A0A5B7FI67_PORTR|nr:Zinc finger and BTB domain-containing protein 7B [Portunus trituberculatus]
MRVHTGAERCSCPECGASFSKRQKLNYHMRKHTGEGLLHCPLCTRSTTNSYSHKKHLETHQTVLGRLLQGAKVLGQTEDCQSLALRTLHNLAWVSARGRSHDQIPSLHPSRITSPVVEDKFNEAVEKCKLETAIKVEKDSLHNQNKSNLGKNKENKKDEIECAPDLKELETTLSISNKKNGIDINPADDNTSKVAWEQMKECSLAEEPLTILARLWQLIIEPKEGQERCDENTHFSRLLVKEEDLQAEINKDASSSVLDFQKLPSRVNLPQDFERYQGNSATTQ